MTNKLFEKLLRFEDLLAKSSTELCDILDEAGIAYQKPNEKDGFAIVFSTRGKLEAIEFTSEAMVSISVMLEKLEDLAGQIANEISATPEKQG